MFCAAEITYFINRRYIYENNIFNNPAISKSGEESNQLAFTCLKSTIETLAKGVKYVQS